MRTVLYANKEVSAWLGANFVMQWTSERPVPKITIDFGDGRKLERTLTGNSVHYVLDADGNPLDALPGLYAPGPFKAALERARLLHAEVQDKPGHERDRLVALFHYARAAALQGRFADAVARAGGEAKSPEPDTEKVTRLNAGDPDFLGRVDHEFASRAIHRSLSKAGVELPILLAATGYDSAALEAISTEMWRTIAATELPDPGLDSRSLALMAREAGATGLRADALARVRRATNPFAAEKAVRVAVGKMMMGEGRMLNLLNESENALARMAQKFEETLAIDSLRNDYQFHSRIHQWFAMGEVKDLEELNERVYREVFLTPRSDKWLGLADPESFVGIGG
ncbi:MAG: hypothetical protein KF754_00425 [Planctomycetes bacterium]|nr:hypothetical protein [Planctomycetota bacterium]